MDFIRDIARDIASHTDDTNALRALHRLCKAISNELEMLYIEDAIEYDTYKEATEYIANIDDHFSNIIIER